MPTRNTPENTAMSLKNISVPIGMLATILGGAAWLTSTKADVTHLQEKVEKHIIDFKQHKVRIHDKTNKNVEKVNQIEAKLDLVIDQLRRIDRRLDRMARNP